MQHFFDDVSEKKKMYVKILRLNKNYFIFEVIKLSQLFYQFFDEFLLGLKGKTETSGFVFFSIFQESDGVFRVSKLQFYLLGINNMRHVDFCNTRKRQNKSFQIDLRQAILNLVLFIQNEKLNAFLCFFIHRLWG